MKHILRLWTWLRGVTGDDAYDHYVAHLQAAHPERPIPSRSQFYRDREAIRWRSVNRCC